VDIGLHEDGLVHITHMSMQRVHHPSEIVSVGDIITVYVLDVDEAKGRVSLSLLPKEKLDEREAAYKANKARNKNRGNRKNDRKQLAKPKPVSMEDATARLLERFGRRH
jgi:uncharacterized protein